MKNVIANTIIIAIAKQNKGRLPNKNVSDTKKKQKIKTKQKSNLPTKYKRSFLTTYLIVVTSFGK